MSPDRPARLLAAFAILIGSALGIAALGGGWAGGLLTAGAGVAAMLLVRASNEKRVPAPQPVLPQMPDRAASVIDAIGDPVLLIGSGRVRHANPAAQALLGKHILGQDARIAMRHPAVAERLSGDASDGAIEIVGLGAREQRWELNLTRLSDGERIVHLIDRTTRYAAERARVDFVANASHELRTPLSAILGFIETLGDDKAGGDEETRKRFLQVMFDEARRMHRLIDDLISLSRIEAEKYVQPGTSVDLRDLVEEVAGELRDAEGIRRQDLVLAIADDVPPVTGDRTQLSQLIHNLVGNALKYGRPGGAVTIGVGHGDPHMVRLTVADQGDGVAPEHLPRLTERFYRVDSGRSRAMGGTGLGLAIVKHIVERHRGQLDIASKQGVGTTVTVLLPPAMLSQKRHETVTETDRIAASGGSG